MPDDERDPLPIRAMTRGFKLAALPVGFAGRTTLGVGKRLAGAPAEAVLHEIQLRTADQVFTVLGQLKGGAMKLGQAMSIFEAALPEEFAEPYRKTLRKLQDSAPPMPPGVVRRVMVSQFGEQWTDRFAEFNETPAAAASIGQVHRGMWRTENGDDIDVAVKLQYPGAGKALRADLRHLARLSRLFAVIAPSVDVAAIAEELQERVIEELDYALEAQHQQAFADAFRDDPEILVPDVVSHTEQALVSTWLESTGSLADIIDAGSQQERDQYGLRYVRFLFAGPERTGLLHADPHPGNYRVMPDGRLGVVDFGAVARLPEGVPAELGLLLRMAAEGEYAELEAELRRLGFLKPDVKLDADSVGRFVAPFVAPAQSEEFTFNREWLRQQVLRVSAPTAEGLGTSLRINLPREYVLLHRVWVGGIGVLCQLGATARFRDVLEESMPGFAR
ncbi:MAG TPA: AarF/ABC1/UbiB kinase family protein [Aeromicrobium sp.]|nr:AarF/ABC1/UbiB kinase family protein [Aeromicrobium sp.]